MADGKIEAQKTWGASPTGWTAAQGHQPGTREFFDNARRNRDEYEQPWLEEVVPFASMSGKRVLEIGFGPGYDALKFMQNGADYSGIDLTPENVDRTRRHLAFFDFAPDVKQGDAEELPFPDSTFDITYSNGVLHHVPDMEKAFREALRVLRPGGDFYLLIYNKYSVFYILSVLLPHFIAGRFLHESLAERRSRIEFSTADSAPIVNVYSRAELTAILEKAGFKVVSMPTRKCTREDFPLSGRLDALYRRFPAAVYRTIGRIAGWYLIAHAQKN